MRAPLLDQRQTCFAQQAPVFFMPGLGAVSGNILCVATVGVQGFKRGATAAERSLAALLNRIARRLLLSSALSGAVLRRMRGASLTARCLPGSAVIGGPGVRLFHTDPLSCRVYLVVGAWAFSSAILPGAWLIAALRGRVPATALLGAVLRRFPALPFCLQVLLLPLLVSGGQG